MSHNACQIRGTQLKYLANLNDDLVVCNGADWLHDAIHFPKNGICGLQDGALVLVQDMDECFVACVDVLELKLNWPLGAEVPVSWENRTFGDILEETGLAGAFAAYDDDLGHL